VRRVLIIAACGLLGSGAHAASLRTVTALHGPLVLLRDLFDDAGPNAGRVLGPGPGPGDRIIVEAAQLNAIARQFGVAWRSVSPADRAVLEWPGRPLRKDEVTEAVRTAVTAAGAPDDCDIDIPGFSPPTVPTDSRVGVAVSQVDYDAGSFRFTASLTVTAETMNPLDTRISGRVEPMTESPVAATRLLPETVLREEDVRIARVRTSALPAEAALSLDQIVGMQLRRPVPAGSPLRLADLSRPPLVQRGAIVRIELTGQGLSVTGQATALDSGAEGDRIRVQNLSSHAYLYADVTGPGQVRVAPEAQPALSALPARSERRVRQP
jgi:flagella basal body P-ring formation protein FlgA